MPDIVDTYSSIAAPAEGLYKELGSRFIAKAWPVESEERVKEIVDAVRKEYHDARHHCYAYRLGLDGARYRAVDDGEPSSSAGRPILGQIDSLGLSDVLVVVIRYFGGIKLGVPGLIRAYKTAARDALDSAQIISKTATRVCRLTFGYTLTNEVMRLVKDMGLSVGKQQWGEPCTMEVGVRLGSVEAFVRKLSQIPAVKFEML